MKHHSVRAHTLRSACMALSLLAAPVAAEADEAAGRAGLAEARAASGDRTFARLGDQSTLDDLLHHPAFAEFAPLLLPWDGRRYDETMRLSAVDALLPYHSHVNTQDVVGGLNRMIEDADAGRQIFYEFYTPARKKADPSLSNTGLFFFRGRPGAPFALIAPGGGFAYVGSLHEGFPYAAAISARGYNAFVLKYRAGQGGTIATQDMAAALSFIIDHAQELGVSADGYSLWGSSAGARMAAAIGSHGAARFGGARTAAPASVIMAYTGHSDLAATEPPTFVVVGERDSIAPPSVMARRVAALERSGTEVEFHEIEGAGHGFGLGTGTAAEGWADKAIRFWRAQLPSSPNSKEPS